MRIFYALFFLASINCFSQSNSELKQIDKDYSRYYNRVFKPTFKQKELKTSASPTNFIFGKIKKGNKLLSFNNNSSFAISANGESNKFISAIMFGVKHFSTYEFLADDYEQINTSKDLVMKEFLRIKVYTIPDTQKMTISKQEKVNELETITQYNHNGYIKLKHPIVVSYYSSHQESDNGMQKDYKTVIQHNNKIVYAATKKGHRNTLHHNPSINNFGFVYRIGNKNKVITGGLMNHVLNKYLSNIKTDIHEKAVNISNVSDYYNKQNKDLKRLSDKGKLIVGTDSERDLIGV